MNTTFDYIVAGISLRSDFNLVALGLRGFKPFEKQVGGAPDCTIHLNTELDATNLGELTTVSTCYLAEAERDSEFFRYEHGYIYIVEQHGDEERSAIFAIDTRTNRIEINLECKSWNDVALVRFGLWMMFGVVLAQNDAIAIHSSVIESKGRGVLFLGESGTGKSTHTRLWRENIEGAKLLNDDSPIIRIVDGEPRVFGSPWSGKTPCYKDLDYPIAGFCRLSQAPHNKIRRLNVISALGALLPSCPPQFAHDEILQDAICSTLDKVLRKVGVYHLECLPDSEAAHLSHSTIIGHE